MRKEAGRALPADPSDIHLSYSHRQYWWFDADAEPQVWHVSADIYDDSGTEVLIHIADVSIVLVDVYETEDPFGVLDGEDADLGLIAETLFDPATGRLTEGPDDRLEPMGDRILILDSVRRAPEWRGHGIGVLLAGTAIKKLSGGVRAAVCYPAPLDAPAHQRGDENPRERQAAITALAGVWGKLGFEHYRGGVYVLDLNLVTLDDRLRHLRKNAEQRRADD
ncbi:hypothetical protein [Amycolatopsis anabasis]|uniref:hypothetical protein n=1 Tax=Amycolatopsis anabasis TaxID=1840409 RepID=UPI00131EACCC|nr:hypothetical protein [Amycolatopsis anabasis]